MNTITARDSVWIAVIDSLTSGEAVTVKAIADDAGVHDETVRRVLRVAEEELEVLERDSPQAQTYYPRVVAIPETDSEHMRRYLRDTLAEFE
ncbi:hypothetical protein [Haloarcula amylolytica]|uniref:hypothetical protein n=1 Tax=Haloarcula amylolytica TaxID=396317 RepID=UPI003C70F54E